MTRFFYVCLLTAVLYSSGCFLFEEKTPQQLLGYKLVEAVKNNDKDEFKVLFSQDIIEKLSQKDQDLDEAVQAILDKYIKKFNEHYKEFQKNNFYFNYQGSPTEGELYIFFNDKRSAKKNIILENNVWVFNEL